MYGKAKALVFGGAFNPPTRAHIALAELAMRETGREAVVFVPTKSRYIEGFQGKDFAFSGEERLSMLRRIAEKRAWMRVSDFEIRAAWQPRTYVTLCRLREDGTAGALLIGSDKLREMASGWLHIPEIAREFGIVAMERGEDDCAQIIAGDSLLSSLAEHIEIVRTPREFKAASSTAARRLLLQIKTLQGELDVMLPEELKGELYAGYAIPSSTHSHEPRLSLRGCDALGREAACGIRKADPR